MRICIYGAGAIGGHLAGHLGRISSGRTGVTVSVVARGPHLDAIRREGLRVVTPTEEIVSHPVATDDPAGLGPQDYVFITLKAHQVPAALPGIRSLLGPETAVLPPTTGIPWWYFHGLDGPLRDTRIERLDPGHAQWNAIGPQRAIGCVYWVAAEVTAPGVVRADGGNGYPLGEPDGSASDRCRALSAVMNEAGLRAPVRADIRGDIWIKMLNSLAFNAVATLTTATLGQLAEAPDVVDIVRRMMAEGEAVATRLGAAIPVPAEKRIRGTLATAGHRMSMLQDLERGRPLEIDTLLTSIEEMGRLAGVPTPTIDAVYALLRLRARNAGLYG